MDSVEKGVYASEFRLTIPGSWKGMKVLQVLIELGWLHRSNNNFVGAIKLQRNVNQSWSSFLFRRRVCLFSISSFSFFSYLLLHEKK